MLNDEARYLVDDVAVSGLTLMSARQAIYPVRNDDIAIVGMALKSKRLGKRAGCAIESALTYGQEGGGKPPVNSLSTLASNVDRRREYASRYFENETALDEIMSIYEGERL